MDHDNSSPDELVEPGEYVFNENGQLVGQVNAITQSGFEIEMVEPEGENIEELPGQKFGEGYLMWRCGECGEMGELKEGIPDECPACGAPEEALSAMRED
ncbi:hypothetical protein BRD19_03305 [Halobacteriales archaeon SW_7_65_23]|nr:MAG: hypothetical protein BRD19_03305 [Halobacteriales archaeon SW_7_65_23]